ncbi:MAG: endonuclease NucS [Xanthobacteraceae bacterium]
MTRFWIVAPNAVSPTEKFEAAWEFDLANGVISIGWPGLGNVLEMSKDELSAAVARQYPDKPPQTKSLISNVLWAFYREISPGDRIIARRGRKTLGAVGAVSKSAIWSPGKNPKIDHAGYLGVEWQTSPRDLEYGSIVFPMHTLTEVSGEEFNNLLPNNDSATQKYLPIVGNAGEVVEDEQMFVLEKYLEEFIVSNFDAIFQGNLRIYYDSEGNRGQQYTTDIGPIDILAVESQSNSFVVIELKRGRPSDQVIGQILRYMGWVKEKLCADGQEVKGLVICQAQDEKLRGEDGE